MIACVMDTDILEHINRAALRFLEPLTPESTYKIIVEEAIKLVSGDEGYLAMADKGELKIVYSYLQSLGQIKMRKRGFSYTAYVQRKAFVTYPEDYKDVHPEFLKAGIQSTIFIPLSNKGKSIGVINVISKQRSRRFSQRELSILKLFGSLASLAIHKTELYSETKVALEARNLFISMAAHELRTPLTSINGYIQLLQTKLSGANTSESRWIEQLYWEGIRLTNLVNELLEINRIKSGQFQYVLRECSLRQVLERVQGNFRFSYPDRELVVEDRLGVGSDLVIGDYDKLIQVVSDLIDNAVKFSPVDSKVILALTSDKQHLIIGIKDWGSGIPKKDLPRIFEDYFQGTNVSKEGLGLGLYLVNDIIRRLHGMVKIKSRLNKGTNVEVWLPRAKL